MAVNVTRFVPTSTELSEHRPLGHCGRRPVSALFFERDQRGGAPTLGAIAAGNRKWYPKTILWRVLIGRDTFSSLSRMGMHDTDLDANAAMGRRVKAAREQAGLSQQRLAAMIQTSQSCISLWENGINGASVACFFQLADALHVDARWLATGRE